MAMPTYVEASDAIIRRLQEITAITGGVIRWETDLDIFGDSTYNAPFAGIAMVEGGRREEEEVFDASSFVEDMVYEIILVAQDYAGNGFPIKAAEAVMESIRVKLTGYFLNDGAESPVNYDSSPTIWLSWVKDKELESMGASVYRGRFSFWAHRDNV